MIFGSQEESKIGVKRRATHNFITSTLLHPHSKHKGFDSLVFSSLGIGYGIDELKAINADCNCFYGTFHMKLHSTLRTNVRDNCSQYGWFL